MPFIRMRGRYYNPFVPKEVWDENKNGDLNLLEGVDDIASEDTVRRLYRAGELLPHMGRL